MGTFTFPSSPAAQNKQWSLPSRLASTLCKILAMKTYGVVLQLGAVVGGGQGTLCRTAKDANVKPSQCC